MSDPTPQPGHKIGTPAEHHVDIETLFRCAADSDELNDQIREALKVLPLQATSPPSSLASVTSCDALCRTRSPLSTTPSPSRQPS